MVVRDPNTRDLTQQKLRMADDVMVWPVRERGELVYRIEIPELHRFFRVGYQEYVLISLLDGKTTLPQACGLAAARLGSRAPTAAQAGMIARWLLKNELAHLDSDPPPIRQAARAQPNQTAASKLLGRLNPFWMKLSLPYSEHWINRAAARCTSILASQVVVASLLLVIPAVLVLLTRWNEFASSATHLFHPSNWIWLLTTWVVLKLIHEFGHAVACHRQGGTVRETGVVFVLFAPLAYVDVTSCWRMNSRWSRIAVAAAGMYIEIVIAAAAILLWALVDAPHARFLLHNLVLAAGLSTILFNANVLMRFDGYFILADLIDVPNLYGESSTALRRLVTRIVTGETPPAGTLTGWRRSAVLMYGIAALLWRITICVSLAIAASTMFAGAGVLIAGIGIVMWLKQPIQKLLRFLQDLKGRDVNRFVRAVVVSGLIATGFMAFLFWMPVPSSVRAPAVVRYLPETLVRSRADGFVTQIHVSDGAVVRKGDFLIELENRELSHRLAELELTQRQDQIRLRQTIDQHNAGARQVLKEKLVSLEQQISQLQTQVAGLRIRAPRSGKVIARNLDTMIGTYLREGDSVLTVAGKADKEVVAMVDQSVVEDIRPLVGSPIRLRTAGFESYDGKLDRLEPRADDRLSEASLAASEGGTLPVRASTEDEESSLQLLEPHFRTRIGLQPNTAAAIPEGMRMEAAFGYQADPLSQRISRAVRRLWHAAQEQARRY